MNDLAVLTPSFRGDAGLFADLHRSVLTNTEPSVVHHVIVPPSDVDCFRGYVGDRCRLWTHRDLLPRYFLSVPHASGLALNTRRPWPPVRGWIVQQIMKLAGTAAIDAAAVLVVDSDVVFVRKATLDQVAPNGRPTHYRNDGGVTAGMERHVLWDRVARRMLGLSDIAVPPLPDYVSPLNCWDPDVVRSLLAHISTISGRHWVDEVAGQLHVSEFVLYGVFADEVHGVSQARSRDYCHNYYERTPLSPAASAVFAEQMPPDALGVMISSHSRTPTTVRTSTFRRCLDAARKDTACLVAPIGAALALLHRLDQAGTMPL